MKIPAPFRLSSIDEPRYGRFWFLEAFGIVRTFYVDADGLVRNTSRKEFRWDYRTIATLSLPTRVDSPR